MLEKVLNILKNTKKFTSGELIAKELNVSRTAVWKYIVKLRNMGYNIISVTNKGYLLIEKHSLYNKMEIEKEINTFYLGKKIYFFEEISSTNDYAKSIANDSEEGTTIISNYQTKGKGRLDRNWYSSKNEGIFFSLILKPNIELFAITQITLLAGISICNAIKMCTGLDTKIKWPNDIIINDKKVCGILTEVNAQIDKVSYIVLGVGINVNNSEFSLDLKDKATSIFLEIGENIERQKIIGCFLKNFEEKYFIYKKEKNFSKFLEEYKTLCININKKAKVVYYGKEIIGTILDISSLGELIFKTEEDILKISSGEVSLRDINGKYI